MFSTKNFPDKLSSNSWWVAGREMRVLESFCGLLKTVCRYQGSFALKNSGIQEVYFFVCDFSRKFNCRVVTVCLDNKLFCLLFVNIPQREYVIDVPFPLKWTKSVEHMYCCFSCLTEHVALC